MDDDSLTDERLHILEELEDDVRSRHSERARAQPTTAEEATRAVVSAHLEIDPADVHPGQNFERDLGITRLGLVLIGLDLEDLQHVSLNFEKFTDVHTVGDLMRALDLAMRSSRFANSLLAQTR